ncbi:hypothetical protein RI129_005883 [Pyrocoelia pectoralis]|uniref:Myb/SANT-like DNA-binding domain-containing protein n=1 Tax=Pyrocoelia pectoralis TaxID=417401 RepID=A0AAN7VG05_9COLE
MSAVLQAIVDEENNIVYDEQGRIYIYNRLNETTGFMTDNDETRALLGIVHETCSIPSQKRDSEREELVVEAANGCNSKISWSNNRTLKLINLLKLHQEDFKSTKIKNDAVYSMIRDEINSEEGNFSTSQVKDKIKYLKMRYMKKKDNMKATSSGAAAIQFAYYEEMDEIFGKKPNVQPVALASSLKGCSFQDKNEDIGDDNQLLCTTSSGPGPGHATTSSGAGPSHATTPSGAGPSHATSCVTPSDSSPVSRKRHCTDQDVERRHKEKMQLMRDLHEKAIQNFNTQMSKLLEKL